MKHYSQSCEECRMLRREMARALSTALNEAREREATASEPLAVRLRKMTEAEWNEMAEAYSASPYRELQRKAQQHQLLTGHWVLTSLASPLGGAWTSGSA